MSNVNGVNGGTANRISLNVTVPRQTQGASFGEKINHGLHAAGTALTQGASLVGAALPGGGGAVISAALSSVGSLLAGSTSGGGAATAAYAATGVVGFSGSPGSPAAGGSPGAAAGNPNLTAGVGTNGMGAYNTDIASMSAQNSQMLQVQMAMQRENTMFSSISNVLKTKHDTAKNSVGNIR